MLKYLSKNYYLILVIFILYVIFNIVRDNVIDQYFNIDPYESIKDADAYWKATKVRNIFIFINKLVFPLMGIISLILLYKEDGKVIDKWLQIGVIAFIIIILFVSIVSGNF